MYLTRTRFVSEDLFHFRGHLGRVVDGAVLSASIWWTWTQRERIALGNSGQSSRGLKIAVDDGWRVDFNVLMRENMVNHAMQLKTVMMEG